jgi:hypothetical protein
MFSQCIMMLGLVRRVIFSFSSLDCLYMLSELDLNFNASLFFGIILRALMPTNWNEFSRGLQLVIIVYFAHVYDSCANALEYVYLYFQVSPSFLKTVNR